MSNRCCKVQPSLPLLPNWSNRHEAQGKLNGDAGGEKEDTLESADIWTAIEDPTSQRTYYHNKTTGEVSWIEPAVYQSAKPGGRSRGLSVV